MSRWSDRFSSGASASEPASTESSSHSSFKQFTVPQLKNLCSENGINVQQLKLTLKDDLIRALITQEVPVPMTSMQFVQTTGARREPTTTKTVAPSDDDSDDEEEPGTPTTPGATKRVAKFERLKKPWFDTSFLEAAFNERLDQSKGLVAQKNSNPTLFILVGPASVGKSSAKRLFPEMNGYVVNVDVDEIKLYGNDVLPQHPKPKKPDVMQSDVEGIQFKYDLVLMKIRSMVFKNATMYGVGNYKNIILDTTGAMIDQIKMYIRTAKYTFGYTVKVIIVYSEKKQCLERVKLRNRRLPPARYIPPYVVSSIYDTFLRDKEGNKRASIYALGDRMVSVTDELILVDNHSAEAKIVARRTRSELQISPDVMGEDSIVGVDGAFYGLTLIPSEGGQPASIVEGDIEAQIEKAKDEWNIFDQEEKRAKEEREAAKVAPEMGGSRKRRISTRRLRGTRVRKTVKKYSRPHTRRRRRHHHRRHS
jgi:hypothetical protein